MQRIEAEPIRLRRCDRAPALDQRKRAVVVIIERLRLRCLAIGLRSARVVRAVEMLGAQHAIAIRVPVGGGAVQSAAPFVRERGIDAVAHQRMGKEKLGAVRADHLIAQERRRGEIRIANERAYKLERESLTGDRGRLQGRLVAGIEAVHAGKHQRLNRSRYLVRLHAFARIAQELLQEQGIAFGAIDATHQQRIVCKAQELPEFGSFLGPQWAEIDGCHSGAYAGAPGVVERIRLDARGHCENGGAFADRVRPRRRDSPA